MSVLHDMAVAYFQATKHYFWQWAEDGEVIEWTEEEGTICYTTELLNDLSKMDRHLPPMGPLLLTMAIGKPVPGPSAIQAALFKYIEAMNSLNLSADELEEYKVIVNNYLSLLRALPAKYWKGTDRELLLNTLFGHINTFLQGDTAKEMLAMLRSKGTFTNEVTRSVNKDVTHTLRSDLSILKQILQEYPDTATLENKLNAVTDPAPPRPLPIEPPQDLPQQTQIEDLLQELASDGETAMLALLTQRLIAALHLPMHTKGYSQTSIGGVSDITNKGNFDRLLLSELAQDNETLMVRLANNEALYLRREELPDDEPGERFILVDKSIKMWGTPHILAMAAALACAIDNKKHAEILPFALLGDRCAAIDLSSKPEVIAAMQSLSPVLHSGVALSQFTDEHTLKANQEYFLITSDELFHTPAFQQSFAVLRRTDGFVITVNRDCSIHLYKYVAGHRKLLSTAKISLEMPVLPAKPLTVQRIPNVIGNADLPAFLKVRPTPLYLAEQLGNVDHQTSTFARDAGAIVITKHKVLLFWPDKDHAAVEITPDFPDAPRYFFGHDVEFSYILFQAKGAEQLSLYQLNRNTCELFKKDIQYPESIGSILRNSLHSVAFQTGSFYVNIYHRGNQVATIDAASGVMTPKPEFRQDTVTAMWQQSRSWDKHLWKSYHTINTLKHLQISANNNLVVNKHEILFTPLKIVLHQTHVAEPERNVDSRNKLVKLSNVRQNFPKYTWIDGSEAWFDAYRHMLHLRSSDKRLPEVSILLIVSEATACWASDGAVTGPASLVPNHENCIGILEFHQKYIQPFIQVIQQYGTSTPSKPPTHW